MVFQTYNGWDRTCLPTYHTSQWIKSQVVGALAAGALCNNRPLQCLHGCVVRLALARPAAAAVVGVEWPAWFRVAARPDQALGSPPVTLRWSADRRREAGLAPHCSAVRTKRRTLRLTRRDPPPRRPYLSLGGSRGQAAAVC